MPEQFKRHIAYKLRISDILVGKPILDEERFSFLELGDKRIVRVNVVGNVIEKYENPGEKQYSFITLDDGSGQIQIRAFADDVKKLNNINQGQTILVIGVLRYFNNATYISPEITRNLQPEYLLVRKLELEKNRTQSAPQTIGKKEIIAVKDKILDKIKNAETDGGIDKDKIILEIKEVSPNIINQELQKLLEEGIIFEPRPGKVRYLG